MVVILGIDTATTDAAVAVAGGGRVIAESAVPPGADGRPNHSSALLGEVERSVDAAGGWDEIDRIAVGIGPGSYTGLRIGIATGRALAQARGIEIAPVGTLAAVARGIAEVSERSEAPALPVLDARRGQVFAALHGPGGEEVWPPFVAAPEELASRLAALDSAPLAAGEGALRFATELESAGAEVAGASDPVHRIAARHTCALGEEAAAVPPEGIEPDYLREPDADRWIQRDQTEPGG